ncbi:hypothetical protein QAD02_013999 [Eretmocerus hayati]|uniref:Uncharacterized protein n=1 Tax=Eretmocerus hayati TaxID=131215 RepID=A0ACC2P4B8_9HYME|nr:hypothetical protein QAD02_013999 [Eretmocerus hayati]
MTTSKFKFVRVRYDNNGNEATVPVDMIRILEDDGKYVPYTPSRQDVITKRHIRVRHECRDSKCTHVKNHHHFLLASILAIGGQYVFVKKSTPKDSLDAIQAELANGNAKNLVDKQLPLQSTSGLQNKGDGVKSKNQTSAKVDESIQSSTSLRKSHKKFLTENTNAFSSSEELSGEESDQISTQGLGIKKDFDVYLEVSLRQCDTLLMRGLIHFGWLPHEVINRFVVETKDMHDWEGQEPRMKVESERVELVKGELKAM